MHVQKETAVKFMKALHFLLIGLGVMGVVVSSFLIFPFTSFGSYTVISFAQLCVSVALITVGFRGFIREETLRKPIKPTTAGERKQWLRWPQEA